MNCGGYLFKLGEVTATPRRVRLGRGEPGEGPTSARRAPDSEGDGTSLAPPRRGGGDAPRGGRGRWIHMTQDGEPVGGRFAAQLASIWEGLGEGDVNSSNVWAPVSSKKFVPWSKAKMLVW